MDSKTKEKVRDYVFAKAEMAGFMGLDKAASSLFQDSLESDPELARIAGEKLSRKYIKDTLLNDYGKKNRYITKDDILSVIEDIKEEDIIGSKNDFSKGTFLIRSNNRECECVSCSIREWQTAIKRFGLRKDGLRIAFLSCGGVTIDQVESDEAKRILESYGITALIVRPSVESIKFEDLFKIRTDNVYEQAKIVCDYLKTNDGLGAIKSNDIRLNEVKDAIKSIAYILENKFHSYRGFKFEVKYSNGVGNFPTIPYICILPPRQNVNNGVYVGLCFGKGGNGFVLGCAESDTNKKGLKTVIRKSNVLLPKIDVDGVRPGTKYNNTYANPLEIYIDEFNEEAFYSHIQLSMDIAINFLGLNMEPNEKNSLFNLNELRSSLELCELQGIESCLDRFCGLLLTKPFVILTGLSGSGKTKLAQAFSSWICQKDNNQCLIVPVGADWTNREPLLGYPNALNSSEYIKPDSGVVDLLINASNNPQKPYFLILDEMNLSHVERYFADFLSLMESGEELKLHSSDAILDVPKTINMPRNLFVIGTVNIDETTYMFSPKVLDRAGVIEFRVDESDMKSFLSRPNRPSLDKIAGLGENMAADFVRIATADVIAYDKQAFLNTELLKFFNELKKVGSEYGYRTAFEINRFAGIVNSIAPVGEEWTVEQITDAAIIQKLLPKLHGSRNQLVPVLEKLATLCLKDEKIVSVKAKLKMDQATGNDPDVKYPLSFEKIHRMHSRAIKDGFTSFAEA